MGGGGIADEFSKIDSWSECQIPFRTRQHIIIYFYNRSTKNVQNGNELSIPYKACDQISHIRSIQTAT